MNTICPRVLAVVSVAVASCLALIGLAHAQVAPKDATEFTAKANAVVLSDLPFADRQDFEDAQRGFIGTIPELSVPGKAGHPPVWDLTAYGFLKKDAAPPTVNPSLWRIGQLNLNNGLFKVVDRVYQVRGFDLSNMTIIEGDTGLILTDLLITPDMAAKALELYYQHRPKKPVVTVIYTHSHIDHYGGVKGVVKEEDVKAGKVKILAPDGFLKEAVSENVYAGTAMGRRALYQYGGFLPKGEKGQVDAGLGKNTSIGTSTLIPPTDTIMKTGDTRTVDGVQMEFQMAPGTEAPAEMLIWFPQFKLLNAAEDATHTLHNLYTLRGAQVRDAINWWKTLNSAINTYGGKVDVVIAQHHWPMWGRERVVAFMASQRNMFKYLHDQTLNLANKGYTMTEIAEQMKLPDGIGKQWFNRGYYGSVNHDAKAIYQRYLGWYDSNPSHLYNLPPDEAAKRYVDFMGGADAVITKAKASFDKGDYRWVAEVMNHVVFADPDNKAARNLEADALEQLGFQTENPTWRNEFLMGALELRNGVPKLPAAGVASPDTVRAMSPDMLLDYAGIRLNGPKAVGNKARINWKIADSKETYLLELSDGVLIYTEGKQDPKADTTITASKDDFAGLVLGETKPGQAKGVTVEGDSAKVDTLFGLMDDFPGMFNIVTP